MKRREKVRREPMRKKKPETRSPSTEAQAKIRASIEAAVDGVLFGAPSYHPWVKVFFTVDAYGGSGRPRLVAHNAKRDPEELFELTLNPAIMAEHHLEPEEFILRPGRALAAGIVRTLTDAQIIEPTDKLIESEIGEEMVLAEVWRWSKWTREQR